jgi:hypothetical protein
MIINYDKNFLFIHIQKTAGTSIKKNLLLIKGSDSLHYPHTSINHAQLTNNQEYCYKFTFVRNPWDRLYSWYCMILDKGPTSTFYRYILQNSNNFSEFLNLTKVIKDDKKDIFRTSVPNWKSISYNQIDYLHDKTGKMNIDFIGRFENLENDYKFICDTIKIKCTPLLHLNKSKNDNYRKSYNDDDIEKVYKLYRKDIDYFNYTF